MAGSLKDGTLTLVRGIVRGVVPPKTNLLTSKKSPVMISFSIEPVGTSKDASTKLFKIKNAPRIIPSSFTIDSMADPPFR